VVGRWLSPGPRRRVVPGLYTLVGAALLPLVWYPGTIATATCFAVASAATAYQLGSQQAFLDAAPADRRGLAFGLFGTGPTIGQALGPVFAGALADVVGSGARMTVLATTVLASAVFLARLPSIPRPFPMVRRSPDRSPVNGRAPSELCRSVRCEPCTPA
jgi:MFS family permease